MRVTTTTLQMLQAPPDAAPALPDDVRLDRAAEVSPEYARFLYGLVGGPWRWTDRLGWSRQQWVDELSVPGTEFWILYGEGVPLGYLHLQPVPQDDGLHVEIRYFGLVEQAIGRGLGGRLLARGIEAAWTIPERSGLPAVRRVWVHTCSLDGPVALANYRARGFEVCDVQESDEDQPDEPLGSWVSTGGDSARV
ncbi:GNAT family N-acetyltransferase [Flexivirga lutea]